ncbi:hypothetical protein PENCOP_c005G03379 [Penicillium coprophilum]|uniref:Uncharacterized protein n=1 Tax=Penicillium coprophilum TaxID=36646 RepID=A0A1V6UT47_9EURO|nr:hypothetical protein PENCOP_c005G03379 [Penicillium coprophilum]
MGRNAQTLLAVLGALQVLLFAVTALRADMSLIFWVLGLGVWMVGMPWHILSLDLTDRHSGSRIFKSNIKLGLYLTGVSLLELFAVRVFDISLATMNMELR